jgi:hypothetical protein
MKVPVFVIFVLAALATLTGCPGSSAKPSSVPSGGKVMAQQQGGNLANSRSSIFSFEDCVMAGYRILRSMPPQCVTPDSRVFVKGKGQVSGPGMDQPAPGGQTCKNLCGNGQCEQIVCLAIGCPCAETPMNCPQDCASELNGDF